MSDDPGLVGATRVPFIVGVGASAGGLEAVTALLRGLPAAAGAALAVIFVQHLEPNRESGLVEILARATALRVVVATDGAPIEAAHVYVIPPNSTLHVTGASLHVAPRADGVSPFLPIDHLLESLADARGPDAAGVILSGTGTDGAAGIVAIRARGGATFAQDETARFEGMPRAASATGSVEIVASPEAIARDLAELAALAAQGDAAEAAEDELGGVLSLLRRATGVDFAGYKRTTVVRRIRRRLALHRLATFEEYEKLLQDEAGEANELCEELLVHVTGFFRDPAVFAALERLVLPRMVEGRLRDAPIRVWVPGCSTGEEPYSLAITLLELFSRERLDLEIKVFATDVSQQTIERARAGRYGEVIAAQVPPAALQRFFVRTDAGYQVARKLRDQCVFARQDLTRDPPFSNMDLISCRNLMIYLAPTLQRRVLPIFHYALRPGGHLVLGKAETVGAFAGFEPVDAPNKIFTRTSRGPRSWDFAGGGPWAVPPTAGAHRGHLTTQQELHHEADRAILTACAPPSVVVAEDGTVVQFRGQTGPFLQPVSGVASLGLLRLAREELRPAIRDTLEEAHRTGARSRAVSVRLRQEDREQWVSVEVLPIAAGGSDGAAPASTREHAHYVVLFREAPPPLPPAGGASLDSAPAEVLERELASTRAYLQSVVEQLEAANEELRASNEEGVAANEELQSTNEELQTAQEELQATNEELRTVNDELTERHAETARLNDDLTNVLSSVGIPTLLLGRDGVIRRFTPTAAKLWNLLATDVGRPFTDIKPRLTDPDLVEATASALAGQTPPLRLVQDDQGRWYQLAVRPYVTADHKLDGTVITVVDIDPLKRSEQLVRDERDHARSIIDTVREHADGVQERARRSLRQILAAASIAEGIVIVDRHHKIVYASRTAKQMFGYAPGELVGQPLDDLVPEPLRKAYQERLRRFQEAPERRPSFRGRPVAARRKDGTEVPIEVTLSLVEDEGGTLVVAFCTDVTARRESDARLHAYERKLGEMVFDAAIAEARERRRIAADLHDHVGQALALLQIRLGTLRDTLPSEARAGVLECIRTIEQSIAATRTLTFDLSPPILYDLGLKATVAWLAEQLAARYGMEISVEGVDVPELDVDVASVLFRIVRELLTNVVKHAHSSRVKVGFRREGDHVGIDVQDGGVGFDAVLLGSRASPGFGLFSVREQIGRLGGTFEIASASNSGTRVSLRVPLAARALPGVRDRAS